jgi:hypothetical protein
VEYIKFTKKLKKIGEHLIRGKDFDTKKTCGHVFLECFNNIKRTLEKW